MIQLPVAGPTVVVVVDAVVVVDTEDLGVRTVLTAGREPDGMAWAP